MRAEYEKLRLCSQTKLQQLQDELVKVQQHCTDSLLQAEVHKQQVCVYVSVCVTNVLNVFFRLLIKLDFCLCTRLRINCMFFSQI